MGHKIEEHITQTVIVIEKLHLNTSVIMHFHVAENLTFLMNFSKPLLHNTIKGIFKPTLCIISIICV